MRELWVRLLLSECTAYVVPATRALLKMRRLRVHRRVVCSHGPELHVSRSVISRAETSRIETKDLRRRRLGVGNGLCRDERGRRHIIRASPRRCFDLALEPRRITAARSPALPMLDRLDSPPLLAHLHGARARFAVEGLLRICRPRALTRCWAASRATTRRRRACQHASITPDSGRRQYASECPGATTRR